MLVKNHANINTATDLEQVVYDSLEFIGWRNHLSNDSRVFIRPNVTFPFYQKGITTSPEILRILPGLRNDSVDRVIAGESDGGNRSFTADKSHRGHGMPQICEGTDAELVNLSTMPAETVEKTRYGKWVGVHLPSLLVLGIDYLISIPVLKVHIVPSVTLRMRSLWGCHSDTMRCLHHKDLSRKLTLINRKHHSRMVLLDGTRALDGHGPMFWTSVLMNLVISAINPVVADAPGSAVMKVHASTVEQIVKADKEGMGTADLSRVTINADWRPFARAFPVMKTMLDTLARILFNNRKKSPRAWWTLPKYHSSPGLKRSSGMQIFGKSPTS